MSEQTGKNPVTGRQQNPVKIKDVARAAGVSSSTVSRVLSGKIPVDPETAAKIHAEISRLGYVPNLLARSLKEGFSRTIGLIVPDITNPVFPAVALGAEIEAVRSGYQLYLAHSHEDAAQEKMLASLLLRHGAAGILVATACRGEASPADWGLSPVCQVVRLQSRLLPGVAVDQQMVGRLAAERFLSIGRRHPVVLAGDQTLALHRDRISGFCRVMEKAGVPAAQIRIIDSSAPFEDGRAAARQLLAQGRLLPDSIFAASDMQALGVMRTLQTGGIAVPGQVAVIGVDNMGISGLCTPAITAIRQPLQEIGRLGCQRLIAAIANQRLDQAGQAGPPLLDQLPCELLDGETA